MPRPTKQVAFLKRIMKKYSISRRLMAMELGVSKAAVDRWLVPATKTSHRPMPEVAFKLLTCLEESGALEKKFAES